MSQHPQTKVSQKQSFLLSLCVFGLALSSASATGGTPRPQTLPVSADIMLPMVVSPNGRYLAAASGLDVMELYDLKTGRVRLLRPSGNVQQYNDYRMRCYALAFSPDSKTLANGGAELGGYQAINTWDTTTGMHERTFAFTTVGQSLCYTPDGKSIIAADKDNRLHFWNVKTGQSVRSIPGPGGPIICLALSPDGRRIALGTVTPACVVQMRDLRSGRVVWTKPVAMPEGIVSSLAYSPDGQTLARGGQANIIYLHDAHTGAVRAMLSDPVPISLKSWAGNEAARSVAYSPSGHFLAGGGPYRIVVWSARTHKVIFRPQNSGQPFTFLTRQNRLAATEVDIPAPHPAGAHSYLMHPSRRGGNVSLWLLPAP